MCYSMNMSILKLPLSFAIKSMAHGDDKFNRAHKTYGNFNIKKDINYISDDKRSHKLDIYTNPVKQNNMTIFYVHGGGYVYGWKEAHKVFVSWLVDQGFTVVAINYRLGQKDGSISIMDQVKDALEALKFTEDNKNYYCIKTDNLFLLGDSAGGHICLMLDILLHNKEAQDYYEIKELPNIPIKGIALNSTMYDYNAVRKQAKEMLFKRGCKWMLSSKYLDDEFIRKNNPRHYFKNGFKPLPIFASTAHQDYFNSHTIRLNKDCKELNIPITYLFESNPSKEIGHVYNHFCIEMEEGKKCNQMMIDFFRANSKVDN